MKKLLIIASLFAISCTKQQPIQPQDQAQPTHNVQLIVKYTASAEFRTLAHTYSQYCLDCTNDSRLERLEYTKAKGSIIHCYIAKHIDSKLLTVVVTNGDDTTYYKQDTTDISFDLKF
jgi:hypothetical protein